MKKLRRLFCCVLATGAPVCVALSMQNVLAQTGAGRLTIQLTNVIDEAVLDYDKVVVPVAPAEGGVFSVPVICYSGPAVLLRVEDCGANSLRIESSRDLVNWAAFPAPGFQLTLGTNSAAVIPMTGTNQFFRGVWD